jgi:hypothetical protein
MQGFAPNASAPTASGSTSAVAPPVDVPTGVSVSAPGAALVATSSIMGAAPRVLHFGTMPAPASRTVYIGTQNLG